MLKVDVREEGDLKVIELIGAIEENIDFSKYVGDPGKRLRVVAKRLIRINSAGVKAWVRYFDFLHEAGVSVVLTQCSPALVQQLNLISNFNCGAAVDSIYLPFLCDDCDAELIGLYTTDSLREANFRIPRIECTRCGSKKTSFDDIAEEYFSFLMRK